MEFGMNHLFFAHEHFIEKLSWHTSKLLIRLKCESEGENIGRRRSWDEFPNSQHFGGKRGVLELWDRD